MHSIDKTDQDAMTDIPPFARVCIYRRGGNIFIEQEEDVLCFPIMLSPDIIRAIQKAAAE